ncbi:MAG: glucose 1-dehydrogenase [Myxococcales bacterium]|nr:glucose 1-dehydrogenase [Myxococcales bacterium]MCB9644944.1 glucose 1-dehydrogenase [Myxococcales bacterium]
MSKLNGKIAVVTGGNSGIGFAAAKLFIQEGAKVVITGRRRDAVDVAVSELGPQAKGYVVDAGDIKATGDFLQEVGKTHGHIDVLFLNAGIAPFAGIAEQSEEEFDHLFQVNVKGPYFSVQQALPWLRQGSSIIFNGSVVDRKGFQGTSAYSATKAALRSFTRIFASELSPQGIRVNILSPGPISTPIYGKMGKSEEEIQAMGQQFAQMVPLGRFGTAEEVGRAVLFLASDDASFVNGAELDVDGGLAQI